VILRRRILACVAMAAAGVPGHARDVPPGRNVEAAPAGSLAATCPAIAAHAPTGVSIDLAEAVEPAPSWRSPAGPESRGGASVRRPFCRVVGRIEGDIGFEIWLPTQADWNRRMLGAGVGGEAGYFNYTDMARGVEQGFVTASSDTGHKRGESWINNPRKTDNYSYRAYHLLTGTAKALAKAFYGATVSRSYFIGCSGGGRQGLREMQLYPADYDGVLLGAPGQDVPLLAARLIQVYRAQAENPGGNLTAADWALIAEGARKACDARDGLADGVIADPRRCSFAVRTLQCAPGQKEGCLSPAKVKAAAAIIAPLTDDAGHEYDYGLLPGITARPGEMPPLPRQMFGQVIHRDPDWNPLSFDVASDLPAARAAFAQMDASDTDLSRFAARGGKLMLYHGWADASVQPEATIAFFDRLKPARERAEFARLYLVPGMHHCSGGNATDHFGGAGDRAITGDPHTDMLAALIAWVERGDRPGPIVARRLGADGAVDRTRPLCPWPQAAAYRGGDGDDAANFACGPGVSAPHGSGGG
jgi:feruloyl esterase